MPSSLPRLTALPISVESTQRLGANPDHIMRLYCERPGFRALWDDYMICQIGLQHWAASRSPEAQARQIEYTRAARELELEIRREIEASWDLIQDAIAPVVFGDAASILGELRARHGLRGREVFLAPMFPLVEIAWLGHGPGAQVAAFIQSCCEYVCARLGKLAGGLDVLAPRHLQQFTARFLLGGERPPALSELSALGLAYLRAHPDHQLVRAREMALWRSCYRVACCNPTQLPGQKQWNRLLDLAPPGVSCHDFETLASTRLADLLSDMENAWARH